MKNVKISSIVLVLTVFQFIFNVSMTSGLYESEHFNIEHEDYVLVAHLMTLFIVLAIERININIEIERNI